MDGIETKADEMLRSPLGCAFLLAAEAASLSPQDRASQRNCLYLCAHATMDVHLRQGELYFRVREELLRQGQRRRDLALAMLEHPAAAWWFGPLDTTRQVFVPRGRSAPDPSRFTAPPSLFSTGEYNRPDDSGGLFTSTLVDGTAPVFVGLGRLDPFTGGRGRHFQRPPYANWLLSAEPSSRVFEIDSPHAWHDLCVRYPMIADRKSQVPGMEDETGLLIPDWTAVMADWDAVHLTFGGLLTATQVRVESAGGWTYLWNWPIEQTLWLHWMFTQVERMPDREHEESPVRFYPFMFRAGLVGDEWPPEPAPSTTTPEKPPAQFPDPLPPRQWLPSVARLRRVTVDFPDLLPPPDQPPDVYLMPLGSDHERQKAILVLSQWTANGEVVAHSLVGTSIDRPAPLKASGSDIVIIRVVTESAPLHLNARHFEQLQPDGHPTGDPVSLGVWQNPRPFSRNAELNARLAKYNADGDPPGWEFAIRLPETAGESFIKLWAQWFMPGKGGVYSANWTMSARR